MRTPIEHVYDPVIFERLAAAIEDLSIPVDGDALAAVFALRDRLDAKLSQAVAEFDRHQLWDGQGATSMTAWLRDRAGLTGRRAHQVAALARRAGLLPVAAGAWPSGELSGGQVEAIAAAAVAGPLVEVFAAHETELVPTVVGLSVSDTVRVMAHWKAHATADGTVLDGPTTARLACDSALHRLVMAGRSTILDYGTATRTTPVNLWNALIARDHGCRWPGCDRPADWCDAHHLRWASTGGPTSVDNLVLECRRHHHIGHQPGWDTKLLPDATLEITDPTGRTRTTRPPGTLWPMVA